MTAADRAWKLLADGLTPQQIVACLTPQTKPEAIDLARRMPLLHERPEEDRGAALARLATRAGMRRFRLSFAPDGRVVDSPAYNRSEANKLKRELPGDGCAVTYTARYFADKDHFSFVGLGDPPQPFSLSESGYWSHFANPDAVMAMGGPDAYLSAYFAAGRHGWQEFEKSFEGAEPESERKSCKPVVGKHTGKVLEATEPEATVEPESQVPLKQPETSEQPKPKGGQRSLFG